MYKETLKDVTVSAIKIQAKVDKERVTRTLETSIEMPFIGLIARELDQVAVLESLQDFSLEQAKISMSAFSAFAEFSAGGEKREIAVRGKTATASAPKSDTEEAMIKIPLVSSYNEDDLVFLARNLAGQITVSFAKKQLELLNEKEGTA